MWHRNIVLAVTCLVGGLMLTVPASADWLVTREGAEVETRGSWEVQDRSVIFTQPNGTLSSLSVRDVDLDRSVEVTAAKNAAPEKIKTLEKKVVLSLGQQDVARARSRSTPASSDEGPRADIGPGPDSAAASAPGPPSFYDQLTVTTWKKAEHAWLNGVEVTGEILNENINTAMDIMLTVRLHGEKGEILASGVAFLDSKSLLGGRGMTFRVPFEGIRGFADASFEFRAIEVVLGGVDSFFATEESDGK